MKIGVIIGRFQNYELTESHRQLIDEVVSRSDETVILVGQSDVRNTHRYALPFGSIRDMIKQYNPDVAVDVIYDHISNHHWSQKVDELVEGWAQGNEVTLYGGRDSFIPWYFGKFKTEELPIGVEGESATKYRESVGYPQTEEERRGAIWAAYYRYPTMYQVIDAIVMNANGQVLLCRKEGCVFWQLIGGFVDPEDENLVDAVKREVKEETGLEVDPNYFFSTRIEDNRYRKEADKVMSHVFVCTLLGEKFYPEPEDDIIEARWFDPDKLPEVLDTHKTMIERMGWGKEAK